MKYINNFLVHSLFLLTTLFIYTSEQSNSYQEIDALTDKLIAIKKTITDLEAIENAHEMELKEATKKIEDLFQSLYPSDQLKDKVSEIMKVNSREEFFNLISYGFNKKFKKFEGNPHLIQQSTIICNFLGYANNEIINKFLLQEDASRNELYEEFISFTNNLKKENIRKIAQLKESQKNFDRQRELRLLSENLIAREEQIRQSLYRECFANISNFINQKTTERTELKENAKKRCKKLDEELAKQASCRQSITDTEKKDFQKICATVRKEMKALNQQ